MTVGTFASVGVYVSVNICCELFEKTVVSVPSARKWPTVVAFAAICVEPTPALPTTSVPPLFDSVMPSMVSSEVEIVPLVMLAALRFPTCSVPPTLLIVAPSIVIRSALSEPVVIVFALTEPM